MNRTVKLILIIGAICIILLMVVGFVWGKTIVMARANSLFKAGEYQKAQGIYEDLNVDLPTSPYVLHNLGLCFYQQGQYSKASEFLKKAYEMLKKEKLDPANQEKLSAEFCYNLGNAYFKAAAQKSVAPPDKYKLYQEALDSFRNALIVNPHDQDAKYNYELTLLRIEQKNKPQPSQDQKEQQQQQKEEAEAMLKMTEHGDQYQNQIFIDNNPNGKDW